MGRVNGRGVTIGVSEGKAEETTTKLRTPVRKEVPRSLSGKSKGIGKAEL